MCWAQGPRNKLARSNGGNPCASGLTPISRPRFPQAFGSFSAISKGVAWKLDGEGPRILKGLEHDVEIHDDVMFPHELDNFSKAEYLGTESVRGESCYQVRLTPKRTRLKPENYWVSINTGLVVRIRTWDFEDGEWTPLDGWLSDYRKLPNGLLMPYRVDAELSGTKISFVFRKIELNTRFGENEVKYPASVAKLAR